ncbi:hypothetical protein AAHB33_16595 [Paenarthrobacter sp. S56]|uniref:hypothetical protein n=1 Tax=Paenarthrobacter sp. S56 TaxID=3138179 RepID=UPI00321AC8DC
MALQLSIEELENLDTPDDTPLVHPGRRRHHHRRHRRRNRGYLAVTWLRTRVVSFLGRPRVLPLPPPPRTS